MIVEKIENSEKSTFLTFECGCKASNKCNDIQLQLCRSHKCEKIDIVLKKIVSAINAIVCAREYVEKAFARAACAMIFADVCPLLEESDKIKFIEGGETFEPDAPVRRAIIMNRLKYWQGGVL